MAYTILNTDGTTLLLLADNEIDNVTTSLTLVGRNIDGYGEYLNNNFVKLTANFASSSGSPPRSPLKGQLWYDTTSRRLKIYDNGFKSLNGAIVANDQPSDLSSGDLWFDSTNNQLNLYSNNSTYLIGPAFPKSVGKNGWQLPTAPIKDFGLNVQKVSLLNNYGAFVGMMSTTSFRISTSDALTYFNTSTATTIVSGLTIKGDIQHTGKTNNSYLSLTVDIDKITPSNADITDINHFYNQNNVIKEILNVMYPINTTTNATILNQGNSVSVEKGILSGSECRVLCLFTSPQPGYQSRRFLAKRDGKWDIYPINSALDNIITTNYGL